MLIRRHDHCVERHLAAVASLVTFLAYDESAEKQEDELIFIRYIFLNLFTADILGLLSIRVLTSKKRHQFVVENYIARSEKMNLFNADNYSFGCIPVLTKCKRHLILAEKYIAHSE